jgi:hypothetical protein
MARRGVQFALCLLLVVTASASAQDLIDRVVARVDGVAITLTDVRAALGLGVVSAPAGADAVGAGMRQLIDRQLMLTEVQRFPPPEPPAAALDREVARLTAAAGDGLTALMQSTGTTRQRIQDLARGNLRILAYLDERFGPAEQVTDDDAAQYYRDHETEFTRDGRLAPFEEVAELARQRTSTGRRNAAIEQWLGDLRARTDIVVNPAVVAP